MADIVPVDNQILDTEYYGLNLIRPLKLTGAFLNILRHYFTRTDLLRTERFRNKPNAGLSIEEQTNVLITTPFSWRPDVADMRPSILVRRLEWRPRKLGMQDGLINFSPDKDYAEYVVSYVGTHAIICNSRESGEVDMMIEEVMNCFIWLGPFIRRALSLATFGVVLIDKVTMSTVNRDYFTCPVVLKYEWSEGWIYDKNIPELSEMVKLAIQSKPDVEL